LITFVKERVAGKGEAALTRKPDRWIGSEASEAQFPILNFIFKVKLKLFATSSLVQSSSHPYQQISKDVTFPLVPQCSDTLRDGPV
jgi:hypothetical protein